jgi:hypothetical protein
VGTPGSASSERRQASWLASQPAECRTSSHHSKPSAEHRIAPDYFDDFLNRD